MGDRFQLNSRKRLAFMRSTCSVDALRGRTDNAVGATDVMDASIGVDGSHLLITVEAALGGGLVLVGRDGCYRDLASIHGTYRRVEESLPAFKLIVAASKSLGPTQIDWFLDSPVSNSARLKVLRDNEIGHPTPSAPMPT